MNVTVERPARLAGRLVVPGDKSISHRSLLFGSLAEGTTEVTGLLGSADVEATRSCLAALGVDIVAGNEAGTVLVHGRGLLGLRPPEKTLDCMNSGTTMRLLLGILAGQPFTSRLTGDGSLRRRPMRRVAAPLEKMGAAITLTGGEYAPLSVAGKVPLSPLDYSLPVASAQLKSALLLAGLFADGTTRLRGEIASRDHTERMLPRFGVAVRLETLPEGAVLSIAGKQRLQAARVAVPGDPSAAAFFMVAASLVEGADVVLPGVLLNPTRTGLLQVLRRMGASIDVEKTASEPEPVGTLRIRPAKLFGTTIAAAEVPALLDELPVFAIAAARAHGVTTVRGAQELRVKESDRIAELAAGLRAMGCEIETAPDGFTISGPQRFSGAVIDPHGDHRICMAFAVAGLVADSPTTLLGAECVDVSFPGFFRHLGALTSG